VTGDVAEGRPPDVPGGVPRDRRTPPRTAVTLAIGGTSVLAIAVTARLAVQPGVQRAQTGAVRWFNHPPQPFAAVLAAANPLLRPVPLFVVAIVLAGWIYLSARHTAQRLEELRALAVSCLVAKVVGHGLKALADQERPLAVLSGLDTHGYPTSPRGNAYPSAHTALVVAAVAGLWPWMRWPQRVAGLVFAVLVASNRLYIGAHWPIDVLGGLAVGLLSASLAWLIAARWPLRAR
jgi:membrane-associated phospholipid phosphatase